MDPRVAELARQTAEYYPQAGFEWLDDLQVRCKGVTLLITQGFMLRSPDKDRMVLFKDPEFLSEYLELFKDIDVKNMVEVGIFNGGSAVFFWNLLQPSQLCCIDINPGAEQLTEYIAREQLQGSIGTYFGTDQSDRPRVNAILDEQFGSEALDLVIDDASHLYGPSLATFEIMFPRLRPGAIYVLEDWKVHLGFPDYGRDAEAGDPMLHRLVQELVDVAIVSAETISDVVMHHNFVAFTRGEGDLDAGAFSVRSILESARDQLER